ncbi:MAG: MotA/TolQ/ExbB proton channel family protein [Kiritimatiellae bacterium]|nr:MotA/TolQ/ExbB proton channel family protein [Kiritimatiellia bacterium]MDD3544272.1 MotA/TolQ/ExbB proton channel family protein [Kiritimatiellia bacterium]MDD4025716.1 MotA/TolQ/ExbB proton channel family protein [Kiritimatiellia bacterium]
MNIFWQGGPVFWLLVFAGVAAVAVFFERLLHLRRAQIDYDDFLKGVCNVLENGNVDEAMVICEETPGPVAAVTLTAIRHRKGSLAAMREAVDNKGRAELSRMERRLASLAVTCQTAPLLGLLGTLLGVVKIVQDMNEQAPVIQSTDLTEGLMRALLAAAAGLMVAVPCHVMYALLMVRIERIVLDMEAAASEIVAFLTKQNTSML